jgi:HPt (histidine-containing phosphotransfer) domain-containing protein
MENEPLNLDQLLSLVGNDRAFFKELLQTFVTSIESSLEKLKDACATKDRHEIGVIAHQIAPSIHQVASDSLYQLIKTIEQNSKHEGSDTALLTSVNILSNRLENVLTQVRTQLSKP